MEADRKLVLYIAMSLDGYIATPEGNLDFLSMVEQEGQDYGYQDFTNTIDTIIIGRKSYDKVPSMGFAYPHADKDVYIISRTQHPPVGNFKYYTGDLAELVTSLKSKPGRHIYCDGGAEIVTELLQHKLIDEFVISIIPILLGDGIRLFKDGRPEQKLKLLFVKQFEKGLAQLHYIV
jgi:dihydrofolate reductase